MPAAIGARKHSIGSSIHGRNAIAASTKHNGVKKRVIRLKGIVAAKAVLAAPIPHHKPPSRNKEK